jgi:hypothetical protein
VLIAIHVEDTSYTPWRHNVAGEVITAEGGHDAAIDIIHQTEDPACI